MMLIQKKFIAALFMAFVFSATFGIALALAAPATVPVGYVDFYYLISHHPDTPKANEALRDEEKAVKQEFDAKAPGLSDQGKKALDRELGKRLEQKRLELLKPISDKTVAAANEVAKEKGLAIVISSREVVCGGVDITADVFKKITGKPITP
ncbi:MAG: periplasmic chaperone [Firmicutes bacterium]|nr:periplasmic chaperone [Bacillota bacterium]